MSRWHRFALFSVSIAVAIPLLCSSAYAMLDDSEVQALKDLYGGYKASRDLGEFAAATAPWLDYESASFLRDKSKDLLDTKLPALTQRAKSRMTFSIDDRSYQIEFISLRSGLMVINRKEVEFLPGDTPQVKWDKLMSALEHKSARHSTFDFFQSTAFAAPGDISAERVPIVRQNLTVLANIVLAIQVAAANMGSCSGNDLYWSEANRACNTQLDLLKSGATASDQIKETAAANQKTASCASADNADLDKGEIQDLQNKAKAVGLLNKQKGFFVDQKTFDDTDAIKADQVNALSKANLVNRTIRWKLWQIREGLKKADSTCKAIVAPCLKQLAQNIKGRSISHALKCYADAVADSILSDNPAPKPVNGAGAKK